jgi:hypothetical protein
MLINAAMRNVMMKIDQLNYLALIDTHRTSEVQGGVSADVQVNAYTSKNLSVASADAFAVGKYTQTYTDTRTNLYQGKVSGHSTAYAKGTAYASNGQDTYSVRATDRSSSWW